MNRDQKAAVVDEIAAQLQAAKAVFAVDYRGLSVAQAAELRARLHEVDATFRVVKNSLSERAADKAGADSLKPMLEGPTALALVHGDAALAAKALSDSARRLNILEFKGGLLDGTILSADDVRSISRLPAREILHAQLVGTIAAPITGLVRTLNELIAGVARQLQQIAEQGLVSGEAPASAAAAAAEVTAEVAPESVAEVAAEVAPESEAEVAPESEAEVAAEPEAPVAAPEPEAPEPEAAAEPEAETPAPEPETPAPEPEPPAPEPEAAAPEPEAAAPEPEAAAPEPEAAAPEPEPEPPAVESEAAAAPEAPAPEQPREPEPDAASDAESSDA